MEAFKLPLNGDRQITGLICLPQSKSNHRSRPLVVALHGGTYTSSYFDADEDHSIASVCLSLDIPVICITRPGYGESSPLPLPDEHGSYLHQQGRDLHEVILPAVWETYGGSRTSTIGLVPYGHSIGGILTVIAAAVYANESKASYPLSGIVTCGIGPASHPDMDRIRRDIQQQTTYSPDTGKYSWSQHMKDHLLLSAELNLCSETVMSRHASLDHPAPWQELVETQSHWRNNWRSYATDIKVPYLSALPEHDRLVDVNRKRLEEFRGAFTKCERIEANILPSAPHSVELSHLGRPWMMRVMSFAAECAVVHQMKQSGIHLRTAVAHL